MIGCILIALWLAIVGYALLLGDMPTFGDEPWPVFIFLRVGWALIIGAMTGAVFCGFMAYLYSEWVPTTERGKGWFSIASLRRGDAVQGQFVLGSGRVGSTPRYYYLEVLGGGELRLGSVNAERARLIETADTSPRVTFTNYWKRAWWFWFWPDDSDYWSADYRVYVPPGTALREFHVD